MWFNSYHFNGTTKIPSCFSFLRYLELIDVLKVSNFINFASDNIIYGFLAG